MANLPDLIHSENYCEGIRQLQCVQKKSSTHRRACRTESSTETVLYQLTNETEKSIEQKEICPCTFLDIEGAFDNESHNVQLKKNFRQKQQRKPLG